MMRGVTSISAEVLSMKVFKVDMLKMLWRLVRDRIS